MAERRPSSQAGQCPGMKWQSSPGRAHPQCCAYRKAAENSLGSFEPGEFECLSQKPQRGMRMKQTSPRIGGAVSTLTSSFGAFAA